MSEAEPEIRWNRIAFFLCLAATAAIYLFLKYFPALYSNTLFAVALFVQGIVAGVAFRRRVWLAYTGSYFGLATGALMSSGKAGPLSLVEVLLILPIYCLNTLVGLMAGASAGWALWRDR